MSHFGAVFLGAMQSGGQVLQPAPLRLVQEGGAAGLEHLGRGCRGAEGGTPHGDVLCGQLAGKGITK